MIHSPESPTNSPQVQLEFVETDTDQPMSVKIDQEKLSRLLVDVLDYPENELEKLIITIDRSKSLPRIRFLWSFDKAVSLKKRTDQTELVFKFGGVYQRLEERISATIEKYLDGSISDEELFVYFGSLSNSFVGDEADGNLLGFERFRAELNSGRGLRASKKNYLEKTRKSFLLKKGMHFIGSHLFINALVRLNPNYEEYSVEELENLKDEVHQALFTGDIFNINA